ncbi:type II toxin-antitoxin system RelE/ParE family toxin [Bacteroides sp. 519]|uniref:type II toxin-antitoxin system RelE/ParE family toxin n=1 Tax=Bacteroides sp. 519 TaxID=2302937 RepID=UPI0013D012FB|nr:type II toxin-antitoxin system RelE/ParE family toxin [Bacteroides sp. 519]NDV59640.1 addiction module killer protein [Bacteroides sp. 519]
MVVTFEEEYLQELYEFGVCSSKKHRFQPGVIKAYVKCISRLLEAQKVEDLYRYQSLRYEVLKGDKLGISSIRVNDQYRIEFIVRSEDSDPVITVCNILELSNHYK